MAKESFHVSAATGLCLTILLAVTASTLPAAQDTSTASSKSTAIPTPATVPDANEKSKISGPTGCSPDKKNEMKFGCWMSSSHEDCACGNVCAPQEHGDLRFFDVKDDCVAALLSDKVSKDPCMENPCRNGGQCVRTEGQESGGYKCVCSPNGVSTGFTGRDCTERCPPPKMENENKTVIYSHDCLHMW